MTVRLGTRGSALALAQAKMVREAMVGANPGIVIEIVEITTSGDRIQDVPLTPALGQSFFTKELEDALLDGRVDLAVHSSKDLASSMPAGLAMGAFLPREDPRDVLVSASGVGLAGLPEGAKLGTASVRRKSFLRHLRPDLDFLDLRGNVPTRLEKLRSGTYDAIVLAAAGLRRLG
ncbi:MAG: hydroxymethylbilane synthase, partial [Gemmatimonadota bacterium]|nr:hydroxymethylbilane synthase [Gemmatimonadota bacterium]